MVSADNINLDCLELIISYLSGNDLVSVSLVSRSFLTAVIPRLYRTLTFGLKQAKRYPSITSPFAAVLAHTTLASHVKHIDLWAIPTAKSVLRPKFMNDCVRTISLCKNLGSFTCTLDVMPNFLLALQDKPSLEQMRMIANFTTDQAEQVSKISGLRSLTLESGSWNSINALPRWSEVLRPTLTSLTLHNINTLSPEIMETVLLNLSSLHSLHVIGCPKVDQGVVLRLITFTPHLMSLAFTSYEMSRTSTSAVSPLPRLRHLAIDTHCLSTPNNAVPSIWGTMVSDKITLGDAFIGSLVQSHGTTLAHISLRNCVLSKEVTTLICRQCVYLQTLKLSLPGRDMHSFSDALHHARYLHTLTDTGELHSTHTSRAPISKADIKLLMTRQPALETIFTDGRTWTAVRYPEQVGFELHVKKNKAIPRQWFMPPPRVVVPI